MNSDYAPSASNYAARETFLHWFSSFVQTRGTPIDLATVEEAFQREFPGVDCPRPYIARLVEDVRRTLAMRN
jgi:hypothetical protein